MSAVAASTFADLFDGHWFAVKDTDSRLYALYRRHYSTQHLADSPGRRAFRAGGPAPSIAPFGDYTALLTPDAQAGWLWVRAPGGIWQSGTHGVSCAFFRNEGPVLSSDLIREACDLAWQRWPGERLFTYVWGDKVKTGKQKGRAKAGWCYRKAGWKVAGRNKDGRLTTLEIRP